MGPDGRKRRLYSCLLLAGACAVPKGPAVPASEVETVAHPALGAAGSVHDAHEVHAGSPAAPEPEALASNAGADEAADTRANTRGPTVLIEPPGVPYRFELRFERAFDANAAYFECDSGPVLIHVTNREDPSFVQELPFEQICMVRDASGRPLLNNARLYDDQGMLQIGDFDFDGAPDLAVQDGRDSCYNGPSYHVFLFDRQSKRFRSSQAFTALASEWCGFFGLDPANQELQTSTKSGCCWHQFARWKVVKGVPEQVYRQTVQHVFGPGADEVTVVETEERLERGRWVERVSQKVEKQ